MKKQRQRLVSLLLTICIVLTMLPVMAMAAAVGGTVEYIKDTDSWYSDATKEFMTRETYWNNDVTEQPADYSVDESTETVSIGSPEALVWWAQRVNAGESFAGYTVNITADLDLSAHYWTPICTGTVSYSDDGKYDIAGNQTLDGTTINGNGHTIIGLATQTGVRGPNQDSKPGDGQNCYYDAAFIGYSCCDITIEDLTFDGARIAISEPFDKVVNTYGSSMLAVVVGAQSGGSLTLKNVTVNDADVLAMQKASAFVGNLMGGSTLTVEQCAITNSRFSAYFMVAPIAAYGTSAQVTVNGIKLENNTIRMVDQSWPDGYFQDPDSEAWYINEGSGYDLNASATAVFNDGTSTINGTSVNGTEWTPVAEVNGYQYGSLAAAITAAQDGETVKLLADFTENLSNVLKTLTLDLNGHTLTTNQLVSHGNLTIVDSTVTAEPVVSSDYESVTYESGKIKVTGTAVYAAGGGTVTLKSGTIESDNLGACAQGDTTGKTTISSTFNVEGGYIIAQEFAATAQGKGAALNISGGVLVAKDNAVVAGNGTKTAEKDMGGTTINISGGTMIGHIISNGYIACGVYHPQQGELNITGGTIYADGGVGILMRAGSASITGGTIIATGTTSGGVGDKGNKVPCNGVAYDVAPKAYPGLENGDKVTISGTAKVQSAADSLNIIQREEDNEDVPVEGRIVVEGGYFTSDPSAYVESGYIALAQNGQYVVQQKSDNAEPAEVVAGTPSSNVDAIPEADRKAVKDTIDTIQATGLTGEANAEADSNTVTAAAGAAAINNDPDITGNVNENNVTIVVQPYLDITATGYSNDEGVKSLTLDIIPMVRTVATTANVSSGETIYLQTEGQNTKNAVIMEAGKSLKVTTPITLSIPLPTDFVTDANTPVFVQHKGYEYTATVTSTGSDADRVYTATFTNPHGFSEFNITTKSTAEAELNGTTYTSLTNALADAKNGDTVTVLKDNLTATMSGSTRKITLKNTTSSAITVTINGQALTISASEEENYTYTKPSSSSSGGGSSTPTYSVSAPSSVSNGSISVSPKNAAKGSTVTITVKPDDGYVLDTLTVKDVDGKVVELKKEGSTVYTFKMPASKVTISATFTEETAENENPFVDVFSSDYYYDAVLWAVENGITTGLTATKFGPDQEVSRAQMVTFLWRAAGSPKATASNPFTDVKSSDYYYDAVQWAVANGVTNGTSATTFSPEAPVSRAQAVTFQWRAAGSPKVTASSFSDVSSDAYYADAVAWAVANEITNGVTATKFGPDVTVSRAQAVTFLYREAN